MKQVDVVGAVIQDDHGHVLCALRSDQMSLPGMWEFPGGKIEQDEEPKEALVREIREELNCQIDVGEKIADIVHDYPNIRVHLTTFFATIVSGKPVAQEHKELRWMRKGNLRSLNWAPADIPTIQKIVATQHC